VSTLKPLLIGAHDGDETDWNFENARRKICSVVESNFATNALNSVTA